MTKRYDYDATGRRISLIDTPHASGAVTTRHHYAYTPHGSVSMLWDATANAATASYGYRPYGAADAALTKGDAGEKDVFNPFRYQAQRFDTGSGSVDFGFRRYGPSIGHYLQRDAFEDALGDLGLSIDPLSQNRYALTGGNPISFVDAGGHLAADAEWAEEFARNHGGREPSAQDAFDRELSLAVPGSGAGGSWNDQDWERSYEPRQAIWQEAAGEAGQTAAATAPGTWESLPQFVGARDEVVMGEHTGDNYEGSITSVSRWCPGCAYPPNVSIGANIDEAERRRNLPLSNVWFYDMVRPGGDWDFKEDARRRFVNEQINKALYRSVEDFGNFHFGAVAKAFGIPDYIAELGAGVAQVLWTEFEPSFVRTYFDDPRDNEFIRRGYSYYTAYRSVNPPPVL